MDEYPNMGVEPPTASELYVTLVELFLIYLVLRFGVFPLFGVIWHQSKKLFAWLTKN